MIIVLGSVTALAGREAEASRAPPGLADGAPEMTLYDAAQVAIPV